ncbi:MAG: hypothetical protein QGG54_17480, partial [Gammaproteobacteria bacterium]|nr:hypothetical protein [Gammaproteobacteria bacterium]
MHFVLITRRRAILAFVFSLTSCGPPVVAQHPASNCQDLFPDAVEVPAQHYLDNLEESWFGVLENN